MLEMSSLQDPKLTAALFNGSVGVIPTDTVYGLVCRAADETAVDRLYKLKHREQKPGTIIAASIDQLVELGIKARYLKAVEHYWPNPISIEIPNDLTSLSQNTGRAAFRIPDDKNLTTLLTKTGPLLTTSANQPGKPPANTVDEAKAYFTDQVDFYVDGGDLSGREASTVIRIIDDEIEVRRQGTVKLSETGEIL